VYALFGLIVNKITMALAVSGLCVPLAAQWLHYPIPGIPRLPNGRPNLSAPAPRSSDGHPDLSGIWQLQRAPCAPDAFTACGGSSDGGAREFGDIGVRLPGGLPYRPWAAEVVKKRTADLGKDDPVAWCKPAGALRLLTYPLYRKIIQTPAVTVILSERDVTYRQVFTDGRPLPKDPEPSWNGYSVGKWQGDALVVETVGLRDGTWLDRNGSPMTEAAKMTERFQRTNFGNLEIEVTIDDSKAYTKPWTVRLHQVLVPDTELLDYYCNDNEKDAVHAVGK
jgi:hypothetical protein